MSWLGKMVGGTLGFAIGGPLGAIAGAALGHGFDKSEVRYLEGSSLSYGEESQLTFFVAAFSMLAKLAKVDGRVSEEEIASVEKFMDQDLALNQESKKIAINVFQTATRSPETFQNFALQFYNQFYNQPKILELMVDILFRVSLADGSLTPEEDSLILSAATIFKMRDSDFQSIKLRYVSNVDKYYSILGCSRSDTDEVLKKNYRKLVMEYHPDTIASKGLPEEFTKFATDKFREIQDAYDEIKKERKL